VFKIAAERVGREQHQVFALFQELFQGLGILPHLYRDWPDLQEVKACPACLLVDVEGKFHLDLATQYFSAQIEKVGYHPRKGILIVMQEVAIGDHPGAFDILTAEEFLVFIIPDAAQQGKVAFQHSLRDPHPLQRRRFPTPEVKIHLISGDGIEAPLCPLNDIDGAKHVPVGIAGTESKGAFPFHRGFAQSGGECHHPVLMFHVGAGIVVVRLRHS